MGRKLLTMDFRGIDGVQDRLGRKAAVELRQAIHRDIGEGTENMAEQAYDNAPVETGALRASILASIKREGRMEYIFGSDMPYAQRQEYEHKTKKAYFRRAIWEEKPKLGAKIGLTIKRKLN